jgi:hypothetical protein
LFIDGTGRTAAAEKRELEALRAVVRQQERADTLGIEIAALRDEVGRLRAALCDSRSPMRKHAVCTEQPPSGGRGGRD